MTQTSIFKDWLTINRTSQKRAVPFSAELKEELEAFYLERYAMWFSQGLFGVATSQIPMINVWEYVACLTCKFDVTNQCYSDHDIIDGFGR